MFCFMHVKLSTISTVVVPNHRMEPQKKTVALCLSNESNYRSFIMRLFMSSFCPEINLRISSYFEARTYILQYSE